MEDDTASGAIAYEGRYALLGSSEKVLEFADTVPEGITLVKGLELAKAEVGKPIVYADDVEEILPLPQQKAMPLLRLNPPQAHRKPFRQRVQGLVEKNPLCINRRRFSRIAWGHRGQRVGQDHRDRPQRPVQPDDFV